MVRLKPALQKNGSRRGRVLLFGFLVAVGIFVVVSLATTRAVCLAAEDEAVSSSGMTYRGLWPAGKEFIDGLMKGTISPESACVIVSQIFIDAGDGVLTEEEIGSILDHIKRVNGMNL